jgi:hypothetical protein
MDEYDDSDFDWNIQPDDIYGVSFRERFMRQFQVERNLAYEFFLFQEDAVRDAREMVDLRAQSPSEKSVTAAWTAVSNSATKLMKDLESVEGILEFDVASDLGWHILEQNPEDHLTVISEPQSHEEAAKINATIDRYEAKASEIIAAITKFSLLAEELIEELPPSRRGPKQDWELIFWVQGIRVRWEHLLGRKFTRDVDDSGEPISEAAQFVAMATEGTPYEKTTALNMMKKVISRHRKINIH